MSPTDQYAAVTVDQEPNPPRAVSRATIFRLALREGWRYLIFYLAFGIVMTRAVIFINTNGGVSRFFMGQHNAIIDVVATILALIIGWLFLILTLRSGIHIYRALRFGERAEAEVLDVKVQNLPRRPDGKQIEPEVRQGRWRVYFPGGAVERDFFIDKDWAPLVTPGARIELLVHPKQPQILYVLRPLSPR